MSIENIMRPKGHSVPLKALGLETGLPQSVPSGEFLVETAEAQLRQFRQIYVLGNSEDDDRIVRLLKSIVADMSASLVVAANAKFGNPRLRP